MIKLLIWHNASGIKAHGHPGHAALAITNGANIESYVSWWPEDQDDKQDKQRGYTQGGISTVNNDYLMEMGDNARARLRAGATPRPGQTKSESIQEDGFNVINRYGQWLKRPDVVLTVPAVDDRSNPERATIGLCEKNIEDWWRLYSEKRLGYFKQKYSMASTKHNCAAIVMAALIAGGCDLFLKHDKACFYYLPNDIMNYGTKLRNAIESINNRAQTVNASLLSNHVRISPDSRSQFGSINPDGQGDLWTVDQWRRTSAVSFGRRKEQILQMDQHLTEYWATGQQWTDANRAEKARHVRNIIQAVQSHIIEKPNSDRREAVLKLGSQCILVIRERASIDETWRQELRLAIGAEL